MQYIKQKFMQNKPITEFTALSLLFYHLKKYKNLYKG